VFLFVVASLGQRVGQQHKRWLKWHNLGVTVYFSTFYSTIVDDESRLSLLHELKHTAMYGNPPEATGKMRTRRGSTLVSIQQEVIHHASYCWIEPPAVGYVSYKEACSCAVLDQSPTPAVPLAVSEKIRHIHSVNGVSSCVLHYSSLGLWLWFGFCVGYRYG